MEAGEEGAGDCEREGEEGSVIQDGKMLSMMHIITYQQSHVNGKKSFKLQPVVDEAEGEEKEKEKGVRECGRGGDDYIML